MRVAAVQLNVGRDPAENLPGTLALVEQAIVGGAELVALPECANVLRSESSGLPPEHLTDSPLVAALSDRAKVSKVSILVGSVLVAIEGQDKLVNRQLLIGPDGTIRTSYDKIHLFDVEVGDGQSYRESSRYSAGTEVLTSDLNPGWVLGHSICYDLRFPELYRALALRGANLLAVPAAFTHVTGSAHWHVLLRARAIETGSFVIAPAQCGEHWPGGRRTYGHSLIIAPWGEVMVEASEATAEVIFADLNLDLVAQARGKVPNLKNRRSDLFADSQSR